MNYESYDLKLKGFLYVPQLEKNPILVKQLCINNDVSVEFFPNTFTVKDLRTRNIVLIREVKDGL